MKTQQIKAKMTGATTQNFSTYEEESNQCFCNFFSHDLKGFLYTFFVK